MPRPCLVLLGLWLGLVVASWAAASLSFRTVERVLGPTQRPELGEKLAGLPPSERRMVLRHLASETNRGMFAFAGAAQLGLGLLVLALAWPAGGWPRYLCLAAALLVVGQMLLARSIVDLGRSLDFLPRPLAPGLARRFGALHAGYVISDLLKAALLAAGAWLGGRA
jgi:hypothetical protein